jgi:glutamate carboxypeptidase
VSDLLTFFQDRTDQLVATLEQLVRLESPSSSKAHVDQLGEFILDQCRELGALVRVFPQEEVGDLRLAIWNGEAPGKPILLLCHIDTVWPVGTLETMPLRRDGDRLYGPGTLDMKCGVAITLEVIRGLQARGEFPNRPIWLFLNSEEETGSTHARSVIEDLAAQCGQVFVLEPAAEGEALKSWRKGNAFYVIRTLGLASHAGAAPEAGINAIIEASHQAIALHSLNNLKDGTSVSVTTIHGGVASNVIPPEAVMEVDVRFLKPSEAQRVHEAITGLSPVLPGAQVIVEGGIDRGPMERNAQMIRVVEQAKTLGNAIGLTIREAGVGGVSDGNFTAAMGIPTLDGLGADGQGMHATHEHVIIPTLARRAALLAQIFIAWDVEAVRKDV